jgi:hypothetical protein
MVKQLRLDLDQRKTEWVFSAWLDDVQVADMRALPEKGDVLVHLQIYAWSRELCREYVCCFQAIRIFLKDCGYRLLVACSDHCDTKMKHFWRMMGFEVFGEFERLGRSYAYAVMEA